MEKKVIVIIAESQHPVGKALDLISDWETPDWHIVKGFEANSYLYARVIDLLEEEGIKPEETEPKGKLN